MTFTVSPGLKIGLLFLALQLPALAAFEYPAFSARHAALGGSCVAMTAAADGFLLNPALAIPSGGWSAALSYSQLFNLPELRYASGLLSLPMQQWGFAAAIETLGGNLYSETKFTFNTVRLIGAKGLQVGISGHIYRLSARRYGSAGTWGISLGALYEMTPQIHLGAAIENLNHPALNGYQEELPAPMRLGIAYQPAAVFQAFLSLQKDRWHPPEVSLGMAYQMFKSFHLQTGYTTREDIPSVGFLLRTLKLDIGYALQHHFELGETHFFSVSFRH